MPDPLQPVLRKVWRGKEHAVSAQRLIEGFLKQNPIRFPAEVNHNPRRKVSQRVFVRVENVPEIPPEFGLLISDAVHNLRSSLDHLMFLVAKPTTRSEEKSVQFPLFSSHALFMTDPVRGRKVRIKKWHMPKGAETAIERLQPYTRRQGREVGVLGRLRDISNWDKHRSIPTMLMAPATAKFEILKSGIPNAIARHHFSTRTLKPGAIVAWLEMNPMPPGSKVHVKPKFTGQPVFSEGISRQVERVPVLAMLRQAIDFIEGTVIPDLARFV